MKHVPATVAKAAAGPGASLTCVQFFSFLSWLFLEVYPGLHLAVVVGAQISELDPAVGGSGRCWQGAQFLE